MDVPQREDQKDGSEFAGVRKSGEGRGRNIATRVSSGRKVGGYKVEKERGKIRPCCLPARARTCGREHRRGVSGGVARYGLALTRFNLARSGSATPSEQSEKCSYQETSHAERDEDELERRRGRIGLVRAPERDRVEPRAGTESRWRSNA